MLYKDNKQENHKEGSLDMELFENPTKEYRGAPFWAWNGQLDKARLSRQIDCFRKMGFGGYHMHPRQGLAVEYLSDEFMDFISFCIAKGNEDGMYSYLYDEDRWPSGYAGGLVTREPRFRQRVLIITKAAEFLADVECDPDKAFAEGRPYLVGCYDIQFDKDGFLQEYRKIEAGDAAEHEKYYAYSKTNDPSGRYNFQTYVDIMQPEAIRRFIELTHERYYAVCGQEYGKSVPSIFSDEPRHEPLEQFSEVGETQRALYYWTYECEHSFRERYGYSLVEQLPHLVWDTADQDYCYVRYHYFNHAQELFEKAFFQQISEVTKRQGIAFTGHLMNEHTLLGQISRTGDAMRLYPYFDIPGMDVLFDRVELLTAKQVQSIVHQYGKKGMLSELYGVTGWDFDFKCMKMQGDWQAALGVTLRVPHLAMMSMAGRAKRDYPASYQYQSPWYEEYKYVEDHFARLNTVLSRGRAVVNIAVLHPIETTMLHYSTKEKSAVFLEEQEKKLQELIGWLLYTGIDFDFLNEALLPEQKVSVGSEVRSGLDGTDLCHTGKRWVDADGADGADLCHTGRLRVGKMEYAAVVVPSMDTIRESTLEILEQFRTCGGKVIFLDKCPRYVDGKKSDRAESLYAHAVHAGRDKTELIGLLEEERVVHLQNDDGTDTDDLICQLREETHDRWLFVARAKKLGKTSYERSVCRGRNVRITVEGEYHVTVFDTLTGKSRPAEYHVKDGKTIIDHCFFANDSLLLRLEDGGLSLKTAQEQKQSEVPTKKDSKTSEIAVWDEVYYKRSEPNVVLFDVGRYSLDGTTYSNREYVLEMNRQLSEILNVTYSDAQPYIFRDSREAHMVYVRYEFDSEAELDGLLLAAERMEECRVYLNGVPADGVILGYYVDESIRTVRIPGVRKGRNILDIKLPFSAAGMIEPCYLLGEFDVTLRGCNPTIHQPSNRIGFGPLATQGMPFYGGNITYSTEIDTTEGTARITVSDFGAPCVRVFIDGEDAGLIAFAPFAVEKELSEGRHRIDFLCYGNRNNTFGPVHNKRMNDMDYYIEPDAWEQSCEFWRNGYFLQDTGILSGPAVESWP